MILSPATYIERFSTVFPEQLEMTPWQIVETLDSIINKIIPTLSEDYIINNEVAIHKSATIEQNVVLKGPIIIGENVSIGANAYLRGPIILDMDVHIGAGCEIKQSVIFSKTAVAHFNYVGNSIVGSNVNFEAGSVAANHYNERENKIISVKVGSQIINTGVKKFGSLIGDHCRIGANAVLSPGTILEKGAIVKRLELIEQVSG